jgi:aminoglycoside phosphotransferase (APT) family kinase protein
MGGGEDQIFLKKIIQYYYGRTTPKVKPILTGKFNSTYEVKIKDKVVILRIAPDERTGFIFYEKNMMRQEPEIHQVVKEKTSLPVPEILAYDFSKRLISRDFLIMERIAGVPLSEIYLSPPQVARIYFQLGRYLKELHTKVISATYGYLGAHQVMTPQPTWGQAFEVMWSKLIENIYSIGQYTEEERDFLLHLWQKYQSYFQRPVKSSLLHMDIWAQNILVSTDGEIKGIIDWDRALWGDPEIEFAVLDYCGVSTPSLWQGYGSSPSPEKGAKIRKVFYYLYEVQKYIIIATLRRKSPAQAQQYKKYTWQVISQLT